MQPVDYTTPTADVRTNGRDLLLDRLRLAAAKPDPRIAIGPDRGRIRGWRSWGDRAMPTPPRRRGKPARWLWTA